MRRVPMQALLPFGRKEAVINRQIRERTQGLKVRPGPGRPAKKNARVSHRSRPKLGEKTALHVTIKTRQGVPNLRTRRRFNVIKRAFVRFCQQGRTDSATIGFRLVHFAVLSNHVHFVIEADSKRDLSLGMQKLLHSISRRLNALSVREHGGAVSTKAGPFQQLRGWLGRVFSDRYHAHILKTPTEMAHAVRYVLTNAERHYASAPLAHERGIDLFNSLGATTDDLPQPALALVVSARGFLLRRACRLQLQSFGFASRS